MPVLASVVGVAALTKAHPDGVIWLRYHAPPLVSPTSHRHRRPAWAGSSTWAATVRIDHPTQHRSREFYGVVALRPGQLTVFMARIRSSRARATRERMVPIGHSQTCAALA